ncbi:MAG: hypothetical protein ACREAE_07510 [Nitrosopumilaceae archaeon]
MDSKVTEAKPSKNTKPGIIRGVEIACKRLSERALKVLEDAMKDETLDMKHRLDAAKEILNRAWGRPKQSIEANVNVHSGEVLIEAITQAKQRVVASEKLVEDKPTIN